MKPVNLKKCLKRETTRSENICFIQHFGTYVYKSEKWLQFNINYRMCALKKRSKSPIQKLCCRALLVCPLRGSPFHYDIFVLLCSVGQISQEICISKIANRGKLCNFFDLERFATRFTMPHKKIPQKRDFFMSCRAWIRTRINRSKVCCPTIRRLDSIYFV